VTLTQILSSAVADLAMGIGCGVALACLIGAVMHLDAWLDAGKEEEDGKSA
jgi:ABC-type nitrate/sulfonate/bicarbonate transport system permease component